MSGFKNFTVYEKFIDSLPKLLDNDLSAATWHAGEAFPTEGVVDGMPCYRKDENKLYIRRSGNWELLIDFNNKPVTTSENEARDVAYSVQQLLTDEQKAQARANIGVDVFQVEVDGFVPAPTASNSRNFLKGDGTWATPTNNKVQQNASSANGNYPLLAKSTTGTSSVNGQAIFNANVSVNPSTGTLKATNLSGKLAWTDLTGIPTNVKNAVSFVEGQVLSAEQARQARLNILAAYQTSNTGSLILPNGTIAQRDTAPVAGAIRFNSEKGWFEGYTGTQWVALVSDPAGKNLPTGTCLCGLFKEAPDLFLSLDGSRIEKSDYYDLCNLLWNFNSFRGDGSTYAILPNMHHRFFEGTTSISEVATYVEAGLPNITGNFIPLVYETSWPSGVFAKRSSNINTSWNEYAGDKWGVEEIRLSASYVSSLYSSAINRVQPASIYVLTIVKT